MSEFNIKIYIISLIIIFFLIQVACSRNTHLTSKRGNKIDCNIYTRNIFIIIIISILIWWFYYRGQ